jgi:peroxiredoxin
LAEYRDQDFAAAGARIAALSVDDPARAEMMRTQLALPFTLLCDTQRQVITAWGLLNTREKGGIAFPAVFVLDGSRTVRYRSLDRTATRVGTDAVMTFLRNGMQGATEQPERRTIWPGLGTMATAFGNIVRHGMRVPRK